MKESLNDRLKSYSALAGATLAGVAASGQIAYTDIEPDIILDEVGEYFDLDLNQDGIIDFKVEYADEVLWSGEYGGISYGSGFTGPAIKGFGKYSRILGKSWSNGWYSAYAVDDSTTLYGKFKGSKSFLRGRFNKLFNGEPIEEYGYTNGYFDSVLNKYVGLSFRVENNYHTAWLRVDVIPTNDEDSKFELRIKDFAYRKIPYSSIPAGIGADLITIDPPSNVVASDIDDTYTSADIEVKFDASASDSIVDLYGAMVVKSEKADGLTLDDLIKSGGGDAVDLSADGSPNYTLNIPYGQLDLDGDPVVTGRAYKILVYAMEQAGYYEPSWSISNEITLSSSNAVATNVLGEDIDNKGNASDMQISFAKAADEDTVSEYRIMLLRENRLDEFDSTSAANAIAGRYTTVAPDGTDKVVVLDPSALDYEGNSINQNQGYYAYVVTVLKSGAGYLLSNPSDLIRLTIPAPKITDVSAHDVSDYGDPRDLEVRYMLPKSDTAWSYVRARIVPTDKLNDLTEEDILDGNYAYSKYFTNLDTTGVIDTINMYPYSSDVYGNFVKEGIEYTVYMSATPRGLANKETLGGSATFILTSPIDQITDILAVSIGSNFNPTDWRIISNLPKKSAKVTEYRIMAVPSADAGSFDLAAANSVSDGNYVVANASSEGISEIMPADLTDVDGNTIDSNTEYNFYILAIGNETTTENMLSEASNGVSLEKVNAIDQNAVAATSKVYYNHNGINFYIPAMTETADVLITSINGSVIYNGKLDVGQEVIDPGNINSGIYIVNIRSNEIALTKKLLIK